MTYEYHFNNETISIDIPENDYDVLIEMDRLERNMEKKETRRHVSLQACDRDDNQLPSCVDVEASCIQAIEIQELENALNQLKPRYRTLIQKVFFEMKTVVDIAREQGMDVSGVRKLLKRACEDLKKTLDENVPF